MNVDFNDARGSTMPLLCRLGRHVPRRLPIWNDGYYFSVCRRCNRDIVRSLNGGWQVPRGYRVVWQPARPEGEQMPTLAQDAGPVSAGPVSAGPASGMRADDAPSAAAVTNPGESSEQDYTAAGDALGIPGPGLNAQQDDQSDAPSTQAGTPDALGIPEARASRPQRSSIPDFMNDAGYSSRSPGENGPRDGNSTPPILARGAREELDRIGLANLAAMSNRVFSRVRTPASATGNRTSSGNWNIAAWVVAAVLIVLVATQNLHWRSRREPAVSTQPSIASPRAPAGSSSTVQHSIADDTEAPATVGDSATTPVPESEPPISSGQHVLQTRPLARPKLLSRATVNEMVVASILNCRAGPTVTSPVTMKMLRGAVVTASAKQGEWAYVMHRGRSCWVQSHMLQR